MNETLTSAFYRYILHQASGPFLKYVKARYDVAFACITYLNTTRYFRDPNTSEDGLRLQIVKGFHSLYHYASNIFWLKHLLQYAKSLIHLNDRDMMDLAREDQQIDAALEELLGFWKAAPGHIG